MDKYPGSVKAFPNKKWGYMYDRLPDYPESKHRELMIYKFDRIWYMVARASPHTVYCRLSGADRVHMPKLCEVLYIHSENTFFSDVESLCKERKLFQGRKPINVDALRKRLKQ